MEPIELTVASVEEAAQKVAAQTGIPADQLQVTVVEQLKGLFGQAKLKVRVEASGAAAAPAPAAKPEKPAKAAKEPPVEAVDAEPAPAPRRRSAKVAPVEAEVEPTPEPAPEPEAAPEPPKRRRGKPAAAEAAPAAPEAEAEETEESAVVATQEDADLLLGILNQLLTASGLRAEATVSSLTGKYVNLEVDGRDASFLVGRKGEVLNALQYLLNVISARKLSNGVRVTVESNEFRKRREDVLSKLALEIAEQVRERGEEAVLDALPAFERRIVHQALQDYEGVTTYSEGEEPNRRVVIAPAE